ncbi:Ig-like domain-containing protein [Dietzia aurantiaca]|uniref:Ig-like domain-containing protein n=1 Tax=Dietzia aurantiaca TaxID=983873 RepID=A0ABV9PSL5_9ACTN
MSTTAQQDSGLGQMKINRTVSERAVTYGDEITITSKLERRNANVNLIYWVAEHTPECLKPVPFASLPAQPGAEPVVTWSPSNGTAYTDISNRSEVDATPTVITVDPPLANSWEPPVTMTSRYIVECDAGQLATGGFQFDGTTRDGDFRTMGPTISVQRMGTSVFFAQPTNPEVGQQVTLRVTTSGIPDGGQVAFTVDGQNVGNATVSGNQATLPWTPSGAGTKQVRASFGQTGTHGGSVSQVRDVVVSPTNAASTVAVVAAGTPKVGLSTQLTATVSPAGAGGEVVFLEDGAQIGKAPVGEDGTASIDWVPSASGERTIDVNFSGRSGVAPSNGAIPVTVAAADPSDMATTTTLEPIATARVGQQITLKATVEVDMAGGTVNFYDGNDLIGTAPVQSDGTATLTWDPTTDGERTVRAVFSGHGVYLSSQDTKQAIITPKVVDPEPDPDPDPTDPATGSLGSLTDSLGGGAGGAGSLSSLGR